MAQVQGRVVERLEGEPAWIIIDRLSHKYLGQPYPALAFASALCKFALSALALAYILAGWVALRGLEGAKART